MGVVIVSLTKTFAQNNLPPVFVINTDAALEQRIDIAYYQMLENKDCKWTYNDVTTPPISYH